MIGHQNDYAQYTEPENNISLHIPPSVGHFHKVFISVPHCQNKRQDLSFNLLQYVISKDSRIVLVLDSTTLEKMAGDCPNKKKVWG